MVTGPTPVVDLHDTLLHTATPRYIAATGVAATLIAGVAGTLTSFTEDGLRDMRPQLTEAFVIALGVAAFGCLWWSTFATMNGRRVTRGRTLGPIMPVFVYVAIAVAYLAVNATVHGEARAWAWVAWSLVAFAAHSFVIITFKSSADTIGNPTEHFTQLAVIPIAMAAAVSVGVGFGLLRGVPFLAVPLLMAWMVLELFRAMRGWDRACAQRMRVMQRDFSYDTPSGSVPVTGPTNTGQTPTSPQRTQVMQMTTTEPPARVAGTHHPVRPTWNPVEEARLKAEQQAAASMGAGDAPGPSALDAYMGQQAAPKPAAPPRRRHHTLIPKLLVTFGVVMPLFVGAAAWALVRNGHLELTDEEMLYDATARRTIVLTVVLIAVCNVAAWIWWTTASLANARSRTNTAPWPGIVAATYWVIIAGVMLIVIADRMDLPIVWVFGVLAVVVASIYAYFGVLAAMRQAAGAVGAPKDSWSTLIKMPLYLFVLSMINRGAVAAADSQSVLYAFAAFNVALNIWQAVAFVRAVWSFDSVSRRPPVPKVDDAHVPLFMRHAAGVR